MRFLSLFLIPKISPFVLEIMKAAGFSRITILVYYSSGVKSFEFFFDKLFEVIIELIGHKEGLGRSPKVTSHQFVNPIFDAWIIFAVEYLLSHLVLADVGGNAGIFTCGTWSESHELLGVADDTDTIYIVKPNGEEMTRITKRHLNLSSPIVGLIVQDDASEKKSYL